jgi:hypothetical protein
VDVCTGVWNPCISSTLCVCWGGGVISWTFTAEQCSQHKIAPHCVKVEAPAPKCTSRLAKCVRIGGVGAPVRSAWQLPCDSRANRADCSLSLRHGRLCGVASC